MRWSLWWWMVPALLVFWTVGAHNRLTRLRGAVRQGFAALDTALVQLVGQLPALPVAPVAAEDAAIDAGWSGPRAAALQLTACLEAARRKPQRRSDIAALAVARDVLLAAWQRRAADASAGSVPEGMAALWEQHLTQLRWAVDQYNLAVRQYNAALAQFPAVLLAWILRLRRAQVL